MHLERTVNTPGFDHQRRAVDVNRPVRPRSAPCATLATRAHTVTGGLTSPARLSRFFAVHEGDKVHGTCRRKVRFR
jgi:hypothetical protein